MAPRSFDDMTSLKRNSIAADFNAPVAKKQNCGPLRHHRATWAPTEADRSQVAPQDSTSVNALLERVIALALEAVGFVGVQNGILEAFRVEVEEYMHHLFGDVTRSMLSCNRTRPIADDFLQSLHSHQLLLTSLIPHLNPPVPPEKSQVALPVDDAPQVVHSWQPSLDLFQDGSSSERIRPYIPNHFPEFPSKHTYKATPELPSAKADPRKVRELATEEARLGEAALRKLVGARSDMNTSTSVSSGQGFKSMRAKRDEAWKEAMQSVTLISNDEADFNDVMQGLDSPRPNARYEGAEATSNGYLSSSVNADKRYWRRPAPRRMPKDSTNIVAPWGL